MKKVLLILLVLLTFGCAPKKIVVPTTTSTTIDNSADEKNKLTASDLIVRLSKMMEDISPLVDRSFRIGKTDFRDAFQVAKADLESMKMRIDQKNYAEAILEGNLLMSTLIDIQEKISNASQSGKKKG